MTHATIIAKWPSVADFARDLGLNYQTARFMKRRDSIPPRYWRKVVLAAKGRGIKGVSVESLEKTYRFFEVAA